MDWTFPKMRSAEESHEIGNNLKHKFKSKGILRGSEELLSKMLCNKGGNLLFR